MQTDRNTGNRVSAVDRTACMLTPLSGIPTSISTAASMETDTLGALEITTALAVGPTIGNRRAYRVQER